MTAARELIGAFLLTDVPTRSAILVAEAAKVVYRGQERQNKQGKVDVRIGHKGRANLGAKTGKPRRHDFEIEITSARLDKEQEEAHAANVADIADELVDAYDGAQGGLAILRTGLSASLRFEKITAKRREVRVSKAKQERSAIVDLAVMIWE